jgi:hypothetical protein
MVLNNNVLINNIWYVLYDNYINCVIWYKIFTVFQNVPH